MLNQPVIAAAIVPYPARLAKGPVWPIRQLDAMITSGFMNWNKARHQDKVAAAERQRAPKTNASKTAFRAKFAGLCASCDQAFAIDDPIVSTLENSKRLYHHVACVYVPAAGGVPTDEVGKAFTVPKPGR
jgi:hypothetical protein